MTNSWKVPFLLVVVIFQVADAVSAQEHRIAGLIPKVQKPITMDGKLDDWDGAFVTPVHVGHPEFADRGGQFLYLWDDQSLYLGLRCLDRHPAHVGTDDQIWNGDAVEFYLDTRSGDKLGAVAFGPGTLHMFYTPFTKTDIKPRLGVRDLPEFKNFKLRGAEVAAVKTSSGYTAEFKLPWANFPDFAPNAGTLIGIECELCSSDGGPRVDRTFVYSGPAAVGSPSAFGRVQLVDKIDANTLKSFGRVLLPLSLTRSTNYAWLYGTVCVSPTIESSVAKLEGKLLDSAGKVRKTSTGSQKKLEDGFTLWTGSWELFDLPPGVYTFELVATDKAGGIITSRIEKVIHGNPSLTIGNGSADSWTDFSSGEKALEAWASPTGDWFCAASAHPDPKNPRKLRAEAGHGILVNGPTGRTDDLVTKRNFKDIEAHVEFLIPQGSNSGVKFEGLYEIQILDSYGVKKPKASDCGGIYPRAEEEPQYHHIDEGAPPRTNAARPAGEWQTLDVVFQAPRFDAKDKKVENARFVKVVLNGQVIHENVEVATPTGAAWRLKKEVPEGPLLLQGTHGPVAFRNVRVRPLGQAKNPSSQ
jgi:3-keto-disaccharide hydrolase/cellulose/xylan binding protein with CBM9 domain